MMSNMKTQTWLLEMLVHYWDLEKEVFMIDQIPLQIDLEDIYFITGLSQKGDAVNLKERAQGGLNVSNYIDIYYTPGTDKVRSQIPIKNVRILPIKIILFTIVKEGGSISLHQASRPSIFFTAECLHLISFDWCIGLLTCMKKHQSLVRRGKTKNFC